MPSPPRAQLLGGEVLVPPTTAGPAQIAVLRDPQGSAFSVIHTNG